MEGQVWQSPRTLRIGRTPPRLRQNVGPYCRVRVGRTLEYTSYPGVAHSRVRPTRMWRPRLRKNVLYRVQKLPRVRGGSYTTGDSK